MKFCMVLALAACSALPHAVVASKPVPAPPPAADGTIAPEATAGLYWLPYVTCDRCTTPAALAAYVVPDEKAARAIMHALDGTLALGLPYVIHTDELGVSPSGIAVVIGSFATRDAARAAVAHAAPLAGTRAQVIDVADGDRFVTAAHYVTVIDRGADVPAWSAADVAAVFAALQDSEDPDAHETLESQHAWVERKLAERTPACTVASGELFVVGEREIRWYDLAPVRCDGQRAYVAWTRTLLGHAVIVPDGGGYRLSQVVGAECDSPIIEEWRYDEHGRHRVEEPAPLLAMGEC